MAQASAASSRGLVDAVRVAHGLATRELIHIFHALDHLAPDGVLLVEEGRIVEHDEELRIGRVRAAGRGPWSTRAHMRLGVEFGLEVGVAGTAHAGAHPGSRPAP